MEGRQGYKAGECGKPHSDDEGDDLAVYRIDEDLHTNTPSHKQTECNSPIGTRTAQEYLKQSLKNVTIRGSALCLWRKTQVDVGCM